MPEQRRGWRVHRYRRLPHHVFVVDVRDDADDAAWRGGFNGSPQAICRFSTSALGNIRCARGWGGDRWRLSISLQGAGREPRSGG
jgi:hypothetical protein